MYDINVGAQQNLLPVQTVNNDQGHDLKLKFVLKLHALFESLKIPDVQMDFIAGKVVGLKDPESILASMMVIEKIIFPDWLALEEKRNIEIDASILHLKLLWELSPLTFQLPQNERTLPVFSYGAWGEAIDAIFKSPYWQQKAQQECCDAKAADNSLEHAQDGPKMHYTHEASEQLNFVTGDGVSDSHEAQGAAAGSKKAGAHRNRHSGTEKLTKCPHCEYTSKYAFTVKNHVEFVHMNLKRFKCTKCDKSFKHAKSLRSHYDVYHDNKELKCPQCEKCFKTQSHLTIHLKYDHGDGKKHKCLECTYASRTVIDLKRHVAVKHRGERWVYPSGHISNNKHRGDQGDRKKFKCDSCDYACATKKILGEHVDAVHKGLKNIPCDECDLTFRYTVSLREHVRVVHRGIKRVKRYQCPECDVSSHSKRSIELHIDNIHRGIRPFGCEECDYTTDSKKRLEIHINKVHYKCSVCEFASTSEKRVQLHMQKEHVESQFLNNKTDNLKAVIDALKQRREIMKSLHESLDEEDY